VPSKKPKRVPSRSTEPQASPVPSRSLASAPSAGRDYSVPALQARSPNWRKWRHMPNVKVWQAVALSLNIDPDQVHQARLSNMGFGMIFDEPGDFSNMVDVAGANLEVLGGGTPESSDPAACTVNAFQIRNMGGVYRMGPSRRVAAVGGRAHAHRANYRCGRGRSETTR